MCKLKIMVMKQNQDPDEYGTDVFQQQDEFEHIGESFMETGVLDLILEGLSDVYEPIRFAAERDIEMSLNINKTMHNMYANDVARGGGSTVSRGKGRKSAIPVSPGLMKRGGFCSKPGHKRPSASNFCVSLSECHYLSSGATRRIWCNLHNTNLYENADCRVQRKQGGNGGGGGNGRGNSNRSNNKSGPSQHGSHRQWYICDNSHRPCLLQALPRLLR